MPPRRAVELRVGGQTYRVVATGDDHGVQHLADLVDRKFAEVVPHGVGRNVTAQQAMFLTAMALAAEVEEQRSRALALEGERDRSLRVASRARDVVSRLLQRVDGALANVSSPTPAAPPLAESRRDAEARPSREARFPSPPPRTAGAPPGAELHDADNGGDDDEVIEDDALLDGASPSDHLTPSTLDRLTASAADRSAASTLDRPAASTLDRSAASTLDRSAASTLDRSAPSPLDRLTDPPDAIHEPLLIDLMAPPPPTLRQSTPVNTTRSAGATDVRPAKSPDHRSAKPSDHRAPKPSDHPALKPPPAASKVPAPAHRGGLRLVRQAGSPPDDDTR